MTDPRRPANPELGRFWTIPNVLSMLRIGLVVPLVWLILDDGPLLWMLGLVAVGAVTDFVDGRLARWMRSESDWGKVLDPMADKVAAVGVTGALVVRGALPAWFLALVLLRDALVFGGGVWLGRRIDAVPQSLMTGKVAAGTLTLTVLAALLHAPPGAVYGGVVVTSVLLIISFVQYYRRARQMLQAAEGPPDDPPPGTSSHHVSASATRG